jgi:hypothetical protein
MYYRTFGLCFRFDWTTETKAHGIELTKRHRLELTVSTVPHCRRVGQVAKLHFTAFHVQNDKVSCILLIRVKFDSHHRRYEIMGQAYN